MEFQLLRDVFWKYILDKYLGLFLKNLFTYLSTTIWEMKEKESPPLPGNFWDFFGRNDAEAETPVRWPPHEKGWLTGKDSDAGRDWGQEEKGMAENEMAGWHHWLDGRGSE